MAVGLGLLLSGWALIDLWGGGWSVAGRSLDRQIFLSVAQLTLSAGLLLWTTRRLAGAALILVLAANGYVGAAAIVRDHVVPAMGDSSTPTGPLALSARPWEILAAGQWGTLDDMPDLAVRNDEGAVLRVTIPRVLEDAKDWHILLRREEVRLAPDTVYLLRFRARAAAPRPLAYAIESVESQSTSMVQYGQVRLSPEWQDFVATFKTSAAKDVRVGFRLGHVAVDTEIADPTIEVLHAAPGEVLDWALDLHGPGAADHPATLERPSDPPQRVRIRTAPNAVPGNAYDVQLNHRGLSVRRGKQYTVRFMARAEAERPFAYLVAHAAAPFTEIGLYRTEVATPEWREYSAEFQATEDAAVARLAFDLGQATPTFELRSVVVLEKGAPTTPPASGRSSPLPRVAIQSAALVALVWAIRPWAEAGILAELMAWLSGAIAFLVASAFVLPPSSLRGWFLVTVVGTWATALASLVVFRGGVSRMFARRAFDRSQERPISGWRVNAGYWLGLTWFAAGLVVWSHARAGGLTFVEAGYLLVNRLLTFGLLCGFVHLGASFVRLERSPAIHTVYTIIAGLFPLACVIDFVVTDKTGVALLVWMDTMFEGNGGANLSNLLNFGGYTLRQVAMVCLLSVAFSLVAMRALSPLSPRIDAMLAGRRGLTAIVLGLAMLAGVEAIRASVLGDDTERRFVQTSQLRFFRIGHGGEIPVRIRPTVPSDEARLASVGPVAAGPDVFLVVIDSLRRDAITPRVAPRLSEFAGTWWSAARTFSAGHTSELSWYSLFHSRHSFRWDEPDDGHGAYPLRLLRRLGYRVEARLSSDMRWMGMSDRIFGPTRELADRLDDAGTEVALSERHHHERDRLVIGETIRTIQTRSPDAGRHLYVMELLSAHWNYTWPDEHAVPIADYAKTLDFTRLDYTDEEVQLVRNKYLNAVSWADRLVGDLVDALKRQGRYDNSLIIVTGDHGEDFYEEGRWVHGSNLCRHQTEVPLFVKWPSNIAAPPPRALMGHIDIMPTILGLLDVSPDLLAPLEGISAFQPRSSLLVSRTIQDPDFPGFLLVNETGRTELAVWRSLTNRSLAADRLRIYANQDWADRTDHDHGSSAASDAQRLMTSYGDQIRTLFAEFGPPVEP